MDRPGFSRPFLETRNIRGIVARTVKKRLGYGLGPPVDTLRPSVFTCGTLEIHLNQKESSGVGGKFYPAGGARKSECLLHLGMFVAPAIYIRAPYGWVGAAAILNTPPTPLRSDLVYFLARSQIDVDDFLRAIVLLPHILLTEPNRTFSLPHRRPPAIFS